MGVYESEAKLEEKLIDQLVKQGYKKVQIDTVEDLEKAIDKGEIDLYFDYYNYNNNKYKSTLSTFIEQYVVLGKEEDNHIVTSFESMKDEPLAMLGNDSLYNYFSNNARAKIKTYDNIDDLVKESGNCCGPRNLYSLSNYKI